MRTIQLIVLSAALVLAQNALAHDQAMQGKATHGTVTAVRDEHLTVKTESGPLEVTLTDETKIERDEKAVGREALTTGAHVAVFGTKVPGQGLVAKEIVLGEGGSGAAAEGEGEAHHKH